LPFDPKEPGEAVALGAMANSIHWSSIASTSLVNQIPNCLFLYSFFPSTLLAAFYCSDLSTGSICDLGKRTASRLRPNFLAVCQPKNLSGLCPPDNFDYVADYECTNHLFDQV
jgi:hypothetical protein